MAKLTDMPVEILNAIFRQFMKRRGDQDYVTARKHHKNSAASLAALSSLAQVSKAISKLALPLLYEQIQHKVCIDDFLESGLRAPLTSPHMVHVRAISLHVDCTPTAPKQKPARRSFLNATRKCLARCVHLVHMELIFDGRSSDISMLLLGLATGGMCQQQTLRLVVELSDGYAKHTIFRDVSRFTSLEALSITVTGGIPSLAAPERALPHLKHLTVDQLSDEDDTLHCMALASPETLQTVALWQFDCSPVYTITALGQILGAKSWTNLTSLCLDTYTLVGPDVFELQHPTQLPALQVLQLQVTEDTQLLEMLPTLPCGIRRFVIGGMDMAQLSDILSLIKSGRWLHRGLEQIRLDFFILEQCLWDMPWDQEAFPREFYLASAKGALEAASSKDVRLAPENIMEKLDELLSWEYNEADSEEEDIS